MSAADLHALLVAAGVPVDNHESDLYALATPVALKIIRESGRSWSLFRSQVDGKVWADVPFAFTPWWKARGAR